MPGAHKHTHGRVHAVDIAQDAPYHAAKPRGWGMWSKIAGASLVAVPAAVGMYSVYTARSSQRRVKDVAHAEAVLRSEVEELKKQLALALSVSSLPPPPTHASQNTSAAASSAGSAAGPSTTLDAELALLRREKAAVDEQNKMLRTKVDDLKKSPPPLLGDTVMAGTDFVASLRSDRAKDAELAALRSELKDVKIAREKEREQHLRSEDSRAMAAAPLMTPLMVEGANVAAEDGVGVSEEVEDLKQEKASLKSALSQRNEELAEKERDMQRLLQFLSDTVPFQSLQPQGSNSQPEAESEMYSSSPMSASYSSMSPSSMSASMVSR